MIDLDEEQARMEAMLARREHMALGVTCTEMIDLITSLRQAEKDAARYRWVRSASIAELNEFCNMIRPHRDGFVDDAIIEDDMQCNK